jgi:hypothetical protein
MLRPSTLQHSSASLKPVDSCSDWDRSQNADFMIFNCRQSAGLISIPRRKSVCEVGYSGLSDTIPISPFNSTDFFCCKFLFRPTICLHLCSITFQFHFPPHFLLFFQWNFITNWIFHSLSTPFLYVFSIYSIFHSIFHLNFYSQSLHFSTPLKLIHIIVLLF